MIGFISQKIVQCSGMVVSSSEDKIDLIPDITLWIVLKIGNIILCKIYETILRGHSL